MAKIVAAVAALGSVAALLVSPVSPAVPAAGADPVAGTVVINEIHYHPPEEGEEFLELHNPGGEPVDLGGACFTAGIGGCFPAGTALDPGAFVVAAESPTDYAAAFPSAPVPALAYTGSLSNGGETVAISSGSATVLDTVAYDDASPWPVTPDGEGPSLELVGPMADNASATSWRPSDPAPTPGASNSQLGLGTQPSIDGVVPGSLQADQAISFTAAIHDATSASLEVVIDFAAPITLPLLDDGAHGDGAAADGTYGATLAAQPAGTLLRYRVLASNGSGAASLPRDGAARPRFASLVARPAPTSELPLVDWYLDPDDYAHLVANKDSNGYVPAVVAVEGEVWDGAEVRVSGHTRDLRKLSFKFKMPKGEPLAGSFLAHPVDEFVLDGDLNDASGAVAPLASSIYADSNPSMGQIAKVHVEQNGVDFGLFTFTEEHDALWRARNGFDGPGDEQFEPEDIVGVLASDGSPAALADRYEKVDPDDGDFTHLYELVQAVDAAPTLARAAELRDLFDVPALVDFLATGAIVRHWDTTVHNYQLLRDGRTGRWRFIATDFDTTLTPGAGALFPYGPDVLLSALRTDPAFGEMYLRRLRTLADRYLGSGELDQRLEVMAATVAEDQAADVARWPRAIASAADGEALIAQYLAFRTTDLLATHRNEDEVPAAPTEGLPVGVVAARYAGDGSAALDFVVLENPSAVEAIDLTGWTLTGAGSSTLPPGTVIPAGATVTVPVDEVASAPARASGELVAGVLSSDGLDDGGGLLQVRDAAGALRGGAVLADLVPMVPPAATGLTVEASADQVETVARGGAGVGLTVAVTNHGPASAPSVALTGPGTSCGRSLGPIAVGSSVVVRCATEAGDASDRTYRFRATSGASSYASTRVEVRTLVHQTGYWSHTLPNAPALGAVELGDGGTLQLAVTLAPPTSTPGPTTPPVRWIVASAFEPGRGVPAQGAVVAPAPSISVPFVEGTPIQVAVAARNGGGTGARSALTPELTPRASPSWPYASTAAFVEGVFHDVDGRAPSATELAWYGAFVDGGGSRAAVIESRLAGGRWPSEVEPLVRLYGAYLGRPPDSSGLRYWVAQRAKGRTLTSISSVFAASPEFRRATGTLGDADFVRFVYRSVLGRDPDAGGLDYWMRRLAMGWTRGRTMTTFSESNEGRRRLAPVVGPTVVWFALLGAPPSASAAAPASEWLRSGGALLTVIESVRSSDAYGDSR